MVWPQYFYLGLLQEIRFHRRIRPELLTANVGVTVRTFSEIMGSEATCRSGYVSVAQRFESGGSRIVVTQRAVARVLFCGGFHGVLTDSAHFPGQRLTET